MNIERDKFLTEAMGLKYHELKYKGDSDWYCTLCGVWIYNYNSHTGHHETQFNDHTNIDFSTWEGFGKLWEWSEKQKWWGKFIKMYGKLSCDCGCNDGYMALHFISPNKTYNFPDAVYEFLKEKRHE